MENLIKSRTVEQALEWLDIMGIEVEYTGATKMYEFEYRGNIMVLNADTPEGVIFVSVPIHLFSDSEQENRRLWDAAVNTTADDLSDYIVEFVQNSLAYIAQAYDLPEGTDNLSKKQLVEMLDDIGVKANNLRSAAMIASIPFADMVAEYDKKHGLNFGEEQ